MLFFIFDMTDGVMDIVLHVVFNTEKSTSDIYLGQFLKTWPSHQKHNHVVYTALLLKSLGCWIRAYY